MKKKGKRSSPTPFIVKVVLLHQFTLVAVLGSGISGSLPTSMDLTDERCCTGHEPILPPLLSSLLPPFCTNEQSDLHGYYWRDRKDCGGKMTYCEEPKRYRRLKTLVPVVKLKKGGGKENTHFWHYFSL